MAGRLIHQQLQRRRQRAALLVLIVLLVLAAHALLGHRLQLLWSDWSRPSPPMPPRLQAAFVREMHQTAPPPAPARPPATPAPRANLPTPAALPASAPEPEIKPEPVAAPASEVPAAEPALAAASAPAEPAAAHAEEPGPEWPESTQLSYRLLGHYRGEVHGQAQVQWIREGRRYQVHLDVSIGPSFAPLIARRMSSDGVLGANGIRPQRYDEDTRVLFRERRRVSVQFESRPEGAVVRLADGSERPAPEGVQDTASQFVHLTWLFLTGREALKPGHIVEMPLALPRKLYAWRYEVIGEEVLETPMGNLPTWHLRPLLSPGDKLGRDLRAEVWLAPTLQYLPVRLRIAQDEETYIDLSLNAAPLQASP